MNAATLIAHCRELGAILVPEGKNLRVRASEPLPADILEELRQHKFEVIEHLIKKGFDLRYPGECATKQELKERGETIIRDGYVLLWNNVLHDFVALYINKEDRSRIPPYYVPYHLDELWALYSIEAPLLSPQTLRRLHEEKRSCEP